MGKIDDLDQVYLNGKIVGATGKMYDEEYKNHHSDEYAQFRGYYILDNSLLKINQDNVIAVRVYDGYINGGIYEGPIGLITQEKYIKYWRDRKKKSKNIFELFWE